MMSARSQASGLPLPVLEELMAVIVRATRRSGILLPFAALFVVLAASSPPFATRLNLLNILDQQSAVLIIACAGTLVFIAGGLDLSIGAVYALASVVTADLAQHHNIAVALAGGLLVGALIGLLNGLVVTLLQINALIATLAMSFVVSGIASLMTSGDSITLYDHASYGKLARSMFLTVSSAIWIALAVAILLTVVLSATRLGRYVYAVGGNANAARLAGVRVNAIRMTTFTLSGLAAALAGLVDSSRVLSAQASNGGDALTFTVIAGIVVGGTSIMGGDGAIWKSVSGVLFLALVGNGYNLLGLDPLYQQVTLGVLILVSVGIDRVGDVVRRLNVRGRRGAQPEAA